MPRALEVLKANKAGHEKLAELLLEKEVIFSEDLENIFGVRKWGKPLMVAEAKKELAAGLLENKEAPSESKPTIE